MKSWINHSLVYLSLSSLVLVVPLSGLTVYAQDSTPTPLIEGEENVAAPVEKKLTTADLGQISNKGDVEMPLTRTFVKRTDRTFFASDTVPDDRRDEVLTWYNTSTEGVVNNNFLVLPNSAEQVKLGLVEPDSGNTQYQNNIPKNRPGDSASQLKTTESPFYGVTGIAAKNSIGRTDIGVTASQFSSIYKQLITTDTRLSISQADSVALFGENNGDCNTWVKERDDFFANGFCDPPRVSAQLVRTLYYLLMPKNLGGAGRDFIEVKRIVQYKTTGAENDPDVTTSPLNRLASPHYIDITVKPQTKTVNGQTVSYFANNSSGIASALDISAIDRVRITTRIQKKGIFSTSTTYKFNAPIPIKVAWQSAEGMQQEPLPSLSVQELVPSLGITNILDLLGESDILNDPSFANRPLESIGMGDLARFLGSRLLSSLLNGQDITQFNFGDTIKDFGVLALAGALNLDPNIVRQAKSLSDLEELTGRSWVSQQLNLSSALKGGTLNEILADIGRQQLGKLLGVKSYVLSGYKSVDEFKVKLGQGLIEARLAVPENSFAGESKDKVRSAVGAGRFDLIFQNGLEPAIDEQLGVNLGATKTFLDSGNATEYKRTIGNQVFENTIGKYQVSTGADAIPLHPYTLYQQLISGSNGQTVGTLTHVQDILSRAQNEQRAQIAASLPLAGSTKDQNGIDRDSFFKLCADLQSSVGTVVNGFNGAVTAPSPSDINVPERVIAARDSFMNQYSSIENNLLKAIAIAQNITFRITATPAEAWASIPATDRADLRTLAGKITTPDKDANPFTLNLSSANVSSNSILTSNDITGSGAQANPKEIAQGISTELNSALKAMRTYSGTYGAGQPGNTQSSNRRDQYFNFPAGTLYTAIGGTNAETALADIGVWTLSQRLPNGDEQTAFRNAVNQARLRSEDYGSSTFIPSQAGQQYLADVFLTVHPSYEFRRIGRRILVDRMQNSAEANSIATATNAAGIIQTVTFYTDRMEIISTSLETLRQAAADLKNSTGDEAAKLASQLQSVLTPPSFSNLTGAAIKAIAKDKRSQITQLQYFITHNTTLTQLNSRVLPAMNNLERASMEIIEGKSLTYSSVLPSSLGLDFGTNTVTGGNCDNNVSSFVSDLTGTQNFVRFFGGDDLVANATNTIINESSTKNLDNIFTYLGTAELSKLLELPQATFSIFLGNDIDRDKVDDFFYSVGAGVITAQCGSLRGISKEELIKRGRDYVVSVTIPALANKLGIIMPDWVQPEDIAAMVMGDPEKALFGMGARQLELRLGLPRDMVKNVVYPAGKTSEEREKNRERAIIQAALQMLDVELPLPVGFTLTDDPVMSMGQARIEQVLNLPSGTFYFNDKEMFPEKEALINHLETYFATDWQKDTARVKYSPLYPQIAARERFMSAFGITLPADGRAKRSAAETLASTVKSTKSPTDAQLTALKTAQQDYITAMQNEIDRIRTGQMPTGFESENKTEHDDANNRWQQIMTRLSYVDNALGVDGQTGNTFGTTRKWLVVNSKFSTNAYISAVGEGAATDLAAGGLVAGLKRLGISGQWFDTISQPSNITLIRTIFSSHSVSNTQWAQLYTMLSTMFSIDLDDTLNFEVGTIARIITHPEKADMLLLDQGMRIFSSQILGIDLNSLAYDSTINIKRLVQASIYGAFINPDTGRFEPLNGLNGDRAVIYALGELNDMAIQYASESIVGSSRDGAELWRFLQVPLTILHDAFEGRLQDMGLRTNYIQQAQAARTAWDYNNGDVSDRQRILYTAQYHQMTPAASYYRPSFGGVNQGDNVWQDLGTIIQSGRPVANPGSTQSTAIVSAQDQAALTQTDYDPTQYPSVAPVVGADGTYYPHGTPPAGSTGATDAIRAAGVRQQYIDLRRASLQDIVTYCAKETAYAAMDFGIEKLFNFPTGAISPGIARALIEGNSQQRMNAMFYIGVNYALHQMTNDLPDWLRPLADFQTIQQAASFFINLDNSAQNVQMAFQSGGLFDKIQTIVFPHDLFGDIELPNNTFSALAGYAITGSTDDFRVNGQVIAGLGKTFNTASLMKMGFTFAEKWLGVDSGVLFTAYNNSYQLFKAYDALASFSDAVSSGQAVIQLAASNAAVNQILNNEIANAAIAAPYLSPDQLTSIAARNVSTNEVVVKAVNAKAAQLEADLAGWGVKLVLFALDQALGKSLAKFEQSIGLPAGTIMQALSLGATAAIQLVIMGALGTMFWVSLGIFVLMTLLGFGVTKVRVYATADGYYPFVGKLGKDKPATKNAKNEPGYSQTTSSDITIRDGQLRNTSLSGETCSTETPTGPDSRIAGKKPLDCQLGWFDPTNATAKKEGFMEAARAKVTGLVKDLFTNEYNNGILPKKNVVNYGLADYPTTVYIGKVSQNGEDYYLGKSNPYLQPIKSYFNRRSFIGGETANLVTPEEMNTRVCSADTNYNWGVCSGKMFSTVVHIQW